MKKKSLPLLLFCLSLVILSPASAQSKWAVGYRTGLELVDLNLNKTAFYKENLVWNNEIFLSRTLGKHFEVETSVRLGQKNTVGTSSILDDPWRISYDQTVTHISLYATGRYFLYTKKKLALFTQISLSAIQPIVASHQEHQSKNGGPSTVYDGTEAWKIELLNTITPGIGLNYSFNKRFFLSSTVTAGYKTDGGSYSSTFWETSNIELNDWTGHILIGAGYRF